MEPPLDLPQQQHTAVGGKQKSTVEQHTHKLMWLG
jgi:hypothetical protein